MPLNLWGQVNQMMVCGLLAFSAHFMWSASETLAVHGVKLETLDKRVERLEK